MSAAEPVAHQPRQPGSSAGREGSEGGSRLISVAATYPGGLALALGFRALYLLRFGGEPCSMNVNFLLEAKAMRFGYDVELRMPLLRVLLSALRNAGASATVSLGILYVTAHVLLTLGVLALARTLFGPNPRVRASVALAVAVLPAFATSSGYRNISCTVAAALFVALAALLVGRRPHLARLAAAFVLAVGITICRPEGALFVVALTCALAVGGRRLGAGRVGAAVTAAGLLVGLFVASNHTVSADHGPSTHVWGFYTLYNSSPFLWRLVQNLRHPGSTATEYLRYAETVRSFGGFEENGGSIVRALLSHPGKAALWFAAKPADFLITIVVRDSFTPLVLVLFYFAARRVRREGWVGMGSRWVPLLGAFAVPLGYSMLFSQGGHAPYLLFVAPLLLFVALWGIEPWITGASAVRLRRLGMGTLAAGALVVALMGPDISTSAVFDASARWLQARCGEEGCLVNVVPEVLDAQTWANLQAGAPLPAKDKRAEWHVFRHFPTAYLNQVRWDRRVAEASARGWRGPILYVRSTTKSLQSFSEDFDPEHRLEGEPDLGGATVAATFRDGPDLVEVFALGPMNSPGPRPL